MEPDVGQLMEQVKLLTLNQQVLMNSITTLNTNYNDPLLKLSIPDPVKHIAVFDGNKSLANAWLVDTEETLNLYESFVGQPIYAQIIRTVKSKIKGEAKEVLVAAGNPNTWPEIN